VNVVLSKHADGSVVLTCVRADGSSTWQKHQKHAAFFPLHDLTHYAVESELGVSDAFYGLIAAGWSIDDTEGQGPRGPLPLNAIYVESVVGTLDTERASGSRWTADEFNDSLARHFATSGRALPHVLTDAELGRVRKRRAELFAAWSELPAGGAIHLTFLAP
jgi:hypothetical protein